MYPVPVVTLSAGHLHVESYGPPFLCDTQSGKIWNPNEWLSNVQSEGATNLDISRPLHFWDDDFIFG